MIDFTKLRLRPINLYDLKKSQAYAVLFAKPNECDHSRPVVWFSTELVFSEFFGRWRSRDKWCPSYQYDSHGAAQSCDKPDEDWEELQLFSPHEHLA